MHHVTVIALQSAHRPDKQEIEACLDGLIASAERCGFEPLRARAIYEEPGGPSRTAPTDLAASRVVHDGVVQGRWEK